ncbi:MAG TPA: hydrogenase nickel incorporation protein HypB [Isosphaeraceae bacterium]|nr:hydrogenase nickel incorporation protein HypB [Isosphaeraceae bacterium]
MSEHPRLVQVRQSILKRNDVAARALRERFHQAGTYVVSLVSSPGAGKTEFLEKILGQLRGTDRVAAIVGDLATDNDARRLARSQAPVRQITTGTVCHLEAEMIEAALEGWPLEQLDFLFIENVGNLVCPSTFDLGEDLRLVLVSVTEGEDKPQKYPAIFHTADIAIVTKTDLATAVGFDHQAAHRSIQAVRPGIEVFEVSAKTGAGMAPFLTALRSRRAAARPDRAPPQVGAGRPAVAHASGSGDRPRTPAGAGHEPPSIEDSPRQFGSP